MKSLAFVVVALGLLLAMAARPWPKVIGPRPITTVLYT